VQVSGIVAAGADGLACDSRWAAFHALKVPIAFMRCYSRTRRARDATAAEASVNGFGADSSRSLFQPFKKKRRPFAASVKQPEISIPTRVASAPARDSTFGLFSDILRRIINQLRRVEAFLQSMLSNRSQAIIQGLPEASRRG